MGNLQIPLGKLENELTQLAQQAGPVVTPADSVVSGVLGVIGGHPSEKKAPRVHSTEGLVLTNENKRLIRRLLAHLQKIRTQSQSDTGLNLSNADVQFIDPHIGGFFNTVSGDIGVNAFAIFTDKLREILTHEGFHKRHHENNISKQKLPLALEEGITQLATEFAIGQQTDTYQQYKDIVLDMASVLNVPYLTLCNLYLDGDAPQLNAYWNKYSVVKSRGIAYAEELSQVGDLFMIPSDELWQAAVTMKKNQFERFLDTHKQNAEAQKLRFQKNLATFIHLNARKVRCVLEPNSPANLVITPKPAEFHFAVAA